MTAVKGFNEISYDELMDVNGGDGLTEFGEYCVDTAELIGAAAGIAAIIPGGQSTAAAAGATAAVTWIIGKICIAIGSN